MPELPEVETIVWRLRKGSDNATSIIGKKIEKAMLLWTKTLAFPSPEKFLSRMQDRTILEIQRRGKFIIINLDGYFLVIHLRMSGDLSVNPNRPEDGEKNSFNKKHDRLLLMLYGGDTVVFNDTRKFGRAWLVDHPEEATGQLGPEPSDENLSGGEFHRRLNNHHRQIKPLLLDQTFLAGLGNIYTDEALFFAGIHPLTLSQNIKPDRAEFLLYNIRDVLRAAIMRNGSSIDWVYKGGSFQNQFGVYHRQGKSCQKCGTLIERIIVGQRSTHFCPHCQPVIGKPLV